ncbi:MAG: response regulator [Gammaproteobacteria bacterium]|nr:response regulator [Gammaproteobacteria bacterium]
MTNLLAEARILIVDDVETNRELLALGLAGKYQLAFAVDGLDAVQQLKKSSFDLVLLDLQMPRMDGLATLKYMADDEALRRVPVIVVSAMGDMDKVVRCIELGADDYLDKPINQVLLQARVRSSIEKKRLQDQQASYLLMMEQHNQQLSVQVEQQVEEIVSAHHAAILAMSKLAESKDPETGAHLERLRAYCHLLASQMSLLPAYADVIDQQFVDNIFAASPLHDIGKVGVPDDVLLKPGKLTPEEWVQMRRHTSIGADTLKEVDRLHPGNGFIRMGIEIAESHHERWDGTGYPNGLQGEQIPLAARIVAIADVYDALRSKRSYKDGFSHEKSCAIILEGRGGQFDPAIVDLFEQLATEFARIREQFEDENELIHAAG